MTLSQAIQAIEKKHDMGKWGINLSVQKKDDSAIEIQWGGWAGGRQCTAFKYDDNTREYIPQNWTLAGIVEYLTKDIDSTKTSPELAALSEQLGNANA